MKIKILSLSESALQSLIYGFRHEESYCFRMRYRAVLLKSEGAKFSPYQSTNRVLAAIGKELKIKYTHYAT